MKLQHSYVSSLRRMSKDAFRNLVCENDNVPWVSIHGLAAALEEDLGRPVLTGNQVAFWYALRQAGVHEPVNGYGRVFRTLNS